MKGNAIMSMDQLDLGGRFVGRHKIGMLKLVATSLLFYSLGSQAQTIYYFDRTVGPGTVVGSVTIDNNAIPGQIGPEDIISWSFETNDNLSDPPPAHGPIVISSATGGMTGGNAWNYFSATETELLFDFDGAYADEDVDAMGFNGGGVNSEGAAYSVHYNFAGFINGKLEQLIHFFDDNTVGESHYVEAVHTGNVIVATVDGTPPPPPEPAAYDFQLLDHPGTSATQVFGINQSGEVVGIGVADSIYPFVYSLTLGSLTDIAAPAGYSGMSVVGISNSGDMVGSVISLDGSTRDGYIRSKDSTFAFFSHPDATFQTVPRGINSRGMVSGYRDSPDGTTGFIYDPKRKTFTDIVPSAFTIAHGMNAKGEVVGSAIFWGDQDPCDSTRPADRFERYGWLRTIDGAVVFFQVNGQRTQARGINDAGVVVGDFLDPASGKRKGFAVKLARNTSCAPVNVDSGDALEFPGYDRTLPEGISDSGVIVGIAADQFAAHGFVATPQ